MTNLILATDSYKHSHFLQYPPEARIISAYAEARKGGIAEEAVFFGLQPFLIDYLGKPVTRADIDEAEAILSAHGVPFNRAGWEAIVTDHGGFLPLEITALPEGTLVPTGVPMLQIRNTDPRMPWLTTFVETALLRAVWYPTTVATISREVRQVIASGLQKTSEEPDAQLPFKLHDFGARGVSSGESAALGGMAHLVNFSGTDTLEGIMAARRYYGAEMPGFSIPAAEHSTITSWGRERETQAYANMIETFGGIVAVVSDSYDLTHAVNAIWGGELKDRVLAHEGTLVARPDSGDPVDVPIRVIEDLWRHFGGSVNAKGYRVLDPHVRVIQGDGMTPATIAQLVEELIAAGYAIDNIAFGMGGGLLQKVNRDSLRFALKANAMQDAGGQWHDVSKRPATDPTKGSKAGVQAVVMKDGRMTAVRADESDPADDLLQPVWRDGELLVRHSFDEVRARANG
ncbi:nicotinate phosphoribosyltransferase [Croceicoccus mobilis]|uniref:Nicotinamide phosphoribosyltransferase n=1 Tax=Croceicoccus mobilis TaxID=1703339 RepID=A0A916YUF2_9SPHN|nr:nicotinate phosphoribosyltransferase [Croceicoccus mobilis]GGD60907.1 nicotinate phosphoribosyltransferase [Croceicoccus mobilis]